MPVQINRLITKILNANNQNIDDVCHVFAGFFCLFVGVVVVKVVSIGLAS